MPIEAKSAVIHEIADLMAGYPFRGSISAVGSATTLAVQMKDTDPENGVTWDGAIRTELPGRKRPDWLCEGDVLVVSRGSRFYAVCIDTPPQPAVCSPQFFHVRVKSGHGVLPAFVAWQINQPPFQRQLHQAAEGSNQLSIRQPVFGALTLGIPDLAEQQRIVALANMARQERRVLRQLIRNREMQLDALAEALAANTAHRASPVFLSNIHP